MRGIGQTFSSCMGEGERPGWTCCLCVGGIVRGIGQAFPLCMGGGREAWLDLLLVCGRESEGHRSDLFLLYVGRESPGCTCCLCVGGIVRGIGQTFSSCMGEGESWLYLLLVCGRDSEGHRSDLSLVYGRERERPGWTCCFCVRGIVRGIGQTFSL